MKEKSLIIYLYDHFDEISFGFKPDSKEYENARREREYAYQNLNAILPEGGEKVLENYYEKDSYVTLLEQKEVYRQGVCLGVKFITEAFAENRNSCDF